VKTQYYTAMTLDGFVATVADSLDWLMTLGDPEESSYPAFIAEVGALAMGSATYEWVLASGLAWPYTQPCWVFSSRELALVPGVDVRVVRGDVRPVHAAMREAAGDKNLWVVGGGELAGQFYDAGLLDEVIVQVGAVTLGSGKGVFPRDLTGRPWRVVSAQVMGERFVELRYAVK
jgi:dihydrofolate reductase